MKMQYRQLGNTYMLRIDYGEEILQSLKQMCEQEGIRLAQVSAIGAVDHAVVGVYDLQEKRYHYETERETHIDCVSLISISQLEKTTKWDKYCVSEKVNNSGKSVFDTDFIFSFFRKNDICTNGL